MQMENLVRDVFYCMHRKSLKYLCYTSYCTCKFIRADLITAPACQLTNQRARCLDSIIITSFVKCFRGVSITCISSKQHMILETKILR